MASSEGWQCKLCGFDFERITDLHTHQWGTAISVTNYLEKELLAEVAPKHTFDGFRCSCEKQWTFTNDVEHKLHVILEARRVANARGAAKSKREWFDEDVGAIDRPACGKYLLWSNCLVNGEVPGLARTEDGQVLCRCDREFDSQSAFGSHQESVKKKLLTHGDPTFKKPAGDSKVPTSQERGPGPDSEDPFRRRGGRRDRDRPPRGGDRELGRRRRRGRSREMDDFPPRRRPRRPLTPPPFGGPPPGVDPRGGPHGDPHGPPGSWVTYESGVPHGGPPPYGLPQRGPPRPESKFSDGPPPGVPAPPKVRGRFQTTPPAGPLPQKNISIFIFHLPEEVTDEELKSLFVPHGGVLTSRVVLNPETKRSKGYGFITMDTLENSQRAIAALNGTKVGKKFLSVSLAESVTRSAGGPAGGPPAPAYAQPAPGYAPYPQTPYAPYGTPPPGYPPTPTPGYAPPPGTTPGYPPYGPTTGYGGVPPTYPQPPSSKGRDRSGVSMFVFHIPHSFTDDTLFDLFKPYNALRATVFKDPKSGAGRGYGFVTVPDQDSGQKALEALNGYPVEGKHLKVDFAKTGREKLVNPPPLQPQTGSKVVSSSSSRSSKFSSAAPSLLPPPSAYSQAPPQAYAPVPTSTYTPPSNGSYAPPTTYGAYPEAYPTTPGYDTPPTTAPTYPPGTYQPSSYPSSYASPPTSTPTNDTYNPYPSTNQSYSTPSYAPPPTSATNYPSYSQTYSALPAQGYSTPTSYPTQQTGYQTQQPAYPTQQPAYQTQQPAYQTQGASSFPSTAYPTQPTGGSYPGSYPTQQPPSYPTAQPTYY